MKLITDENSIHHSHSFSIKVCVFVTVYLVKGVGWCGVVWGGGWGYNSELRNKLSLPLSCHCVLFLQREMKIQPCTIESSKLRGVHTSMHKAAHVHAHTSTHSQTQVGY